MKVVIEGEPKEIAEFLREAGARLSDTAVKSTEQLLADELLTLAEKYFDFPNSGIAQVR